ncbi:MAG: ABC transporter permease [Chroococcidiopsidaceae cyanobacterium CP_BM_RX_35]|nr:ABC transporter permease [Chroococcidiopsidaceae cyanobacterium CP_BM_RX_35]
MSSPVCVRINAVSTVEVVGMAFETLWSNKLRTGLTMLGVIIGIASVIAVTSVGQGIQKATEQKIEALGTNLIVVLAGASTTNGINQGIGSTTTLTWADAKAVAEQAPAAVAVTAFLMSQKQVVYSGQNILTSVIGTDLNYPDVKNIHPQAGRFFTQDELNSAQPVVVLGAKVRDELFGVGANPLFFDVRIQGGHYQVIGVMEPKGSVGNVDQDNRVYIPLTNMSARIVGKNALTGVAVTGLCLKARDESQLDAAQFQVTNLLRLRHNIYPPAADDFRVTNQVDIINTFTSVVGLFTIMVMAIAGISLFVGGIGIGNIMLVSVVERTREIGIRKAVGATNVAILSQFLAEAVVVSLIGGGIGIVFGIAIAFGTATGFKFPFVVSFWSVVVGFGLSFIVGLLAGVIPAHNASKLDPIAALRSD